MKTHKPNSTTKLPTPELSAIIRTEAQSAADFLDEPLTNENQITILQKRKQHELQCYLKIVLIRVSNTNENQTDNTFTEKIEKESTCLLSILKRKDLTEA
jgi:D-lyxose ketol-isomerase